MAAQEKALQKELEKHKFSFDQADKDGTGYLTLTELVVVLKTNGYKGSISDMKNLFKHMDKDGDRVVTRDEYLNALKQMPKLTTREWVLRRVFKKIDKDDTGFLSRDEILQATQKDEDARALLSTESAEKLLEELCKDGKVDYEDFLTTFGIEASASVLGQIFQQIDTNNDGTLSKKEMKKVVDSDRELAYNKDKIKDCLDSLPGDEDGKIDYKEFIQIFLTQQKQAKK